MLFGASGTRLGLLSGGCLEADIAVNARKVLASGKARKLMYDGSDEDDIAFRMGIGCGGCIYVFLQEINDGNNYLGLMELHKALETSRKAFFCQLIPEEGEDTKSIVIDSSLEVPKGFESVISKENSRAEVIGGSLWSITVASPPPCLLVVGAGVAGLQAIATAKRMGAIVFATDVRMASKEQVESLGGKFLTVEGSENLETAGGYAKEASDEFKKKQEELLKETLKKIDIVICTALIPGKKAPVIIKDNMINNMQSGSVIYDLAAIQGGNTALTEVDKIIENNGVKIMGETNILNRLPVSASNLYSKNMFNFVDNLFDKENKKININLEDEIIEKTLIK